MIDSNLVTPFIDAAVNVLKIQASVQAKPGQPELMKSIDSFKSDVSGIIGIVSPKYNGTVVISFPENTFLKIMSGMLGEEYSEFNRELADGAGELSNIIFGQAKVVLNERGYGIKLALPQVISGKQHTLSAISKGPAMVIPFTSSAGDFIVSICLSD